MDRLDDQPLVQARLLEVLARVHSSMENVPEARRLIAQSLALRRTQLGGRHPDVANALFYQAAIERNGRSYLLADSLAREALVIRQMPSVPVTRRSPRHSSSWPAWRCT